MPFLLERARAGRRCCGFLLVALPAALLSIAATASAWRSSVYPEDWTPAFTAPDGGFLHDFSYAGYQHGEVPVPDLKGPIFDAVARFGADPSGETDSTAAVQEAIDAAEAAGGGVVFLPKGDYRVGGTLLIDADGIVLRGAGIDSTRVHFTLAESSIDGGAHLRLEGDPQWGADLLLARDGEERSHEVLVEDASPLKPGTEVCLGWTISPEFVEEHGMTGTWRVFNGQWKPFFRRSVVSVDASARPHRVRLDAPLRYPAKVRDSASIRPLLAGAGKRGYLRECGVEDLSVTNAVEKDVALGMNQVAVIEGIGLKDCWFRRVGSIASRHPGASGAHVQSGGIRIGGSRRVTVSDCRIEKSQHHGGGGNGYLFEVRSSSEVLFRDCVAAEGRHNFIQNWDFGATGIVWSRCRTTGATNEYRMTTFSEFHHSLAMACLVDACTLDDGWQGGNRHKESSGAGHSVTGGTYWNSMGAGFLGSWSFGRGYVIGTSPELRVKTRTHMFNPFQGTEPEDLVEGAGEGATLEPASLYEDQLARRLRR